jgi:polyhydroxybutyrate depolymerase
MRKSSAPRRDRPSGLSATLVLVLALAILALGTSCRDRDDDVDSTPTTTSAASATASTVGATSAAPVEIVITEPPSVAQGDPGPRVETETITVGGRERTYSLYIPRFLPSGPAPLVIGLHGGFGSGEQFARTTGFDDRAESGGFLAAYPDGTGVIPTWNGGRCCGYAAREGVDDVAFIEAVIDDISRRYAVDDTRVYAAGHSNGAIMALRLACESDRFRAVAAVAGSLEIESCAPLRPTSILMIHGTADQNHPLEGGVGDNSISQVAFTSVADSMDTLVPAMGCSAADGEVKQGAITRTTWSACTDVAQVQLLVIEGASHAWPGGVPGIGLGGVPTDELNATATIWDFFAALP